MGEAAATWTQISDHILKERLAEISIDCPHLRDEVPLTSVNISSEQGAPSLDSGELHSCPWFQPEVENAKICEKKIKIKIRRKLL